MKVTIALVNLNYLARVVRLGQFSLLDLIKHHAHGQGQQLGPR